MAEPISRIFAAQHDHAARNALNESLLQHGGRRYIGLGYGLCATLYGYVRAWKAALALPPEQPVKIVPGQWWAGTVADVLAAMRDGMHDRINRHLPRYGRGRKWSPDWQGMTWRASRDLNNPRLLIDGLPPELKARFAHRLRNRED